MPMQHPAGKQTLPSQTNSRLYLEPPRPFTIGLKPLSPKDFLQIDDDHLPFRTEKRALYCSIFDDVCKAEPDTRHSQLEVSQLICNNLETHHDDLYEFHPSTAICQQTKLEFPLEQVMPIADVALLISEDLVLMRRDANGWRLVAASLAFPSSWSLRDKFSRSLEAIHGPVPLSEKMGQRINRIFDAMRPEAPLWRTNWALDRDGALRQEKPENRAKDNGRMLGSNVHFRTEFQTLHKLPVSGDILFTIRIKNRPLTSVLNDRHGREKLALLYRHYRDMSDAERDYKGINRNADGLVAWLAENGVAT